MCVMIHTNTNQRNRVTLRRVSVLALHAAIVAIPVLERDQFRFATFDKKERSRSVALFFERSEKNNDSESYESNIY